MKKKNGFTLIELLAIIVILAIIAVITVPIILDIIDNSKKGAASDSAYGYKDAVNKWYIQELSTNHSFMMNNQYTVDDGKLVIDPEDENDEGDENGAEVTDLVDKQRPTRRKLIVIKVKIMKLW